MSLINKMLRDLDRRQAAEGGMEATAPGSLAEHVRPVSAWGAASDYFWRAAAVLMLVALGWIAWVAWQSMHRPADADLQDRSPREKTLGSKAEVPRTPAKPDSVPSTAFAAAAPAPAVPPPALAAPVAIPRAEPAKVAPPAANPSPEPVNVETTVPTAAAPNPIPARSRQRTPSRGRAKEIASVAQAKPVEAAPAGEAAEPAKIDRRLKVNPRDSAENEFRRAVNLVNRGRVAEGMEGFRGALEIDPRHDAARQTLVALLLETKRVDEAAALLEKGLALNADNSGFAMVLARISVERGDVPGALALLQKHAASADRSPDYHAFAAALYQRLDRNKEAIEQYQRALALAPGAGVWWVGLGISLQALQRPKDALEAFTRARSSGSLSPDLSAFAQRRIGQLQ